MGAAFPLLHGHAQALLLVAPHAARRPQQPPQHVGGDLLAAVDLEPLHRVAPASQGLVLGVGGQWSAECLLAVHRPLPQPLAGFQLAPQAAGEGLKAVLGVAVVLERDALVVTHFEHQIGRLGEVLHREGAVGQQPTQEHTGAPIRRQLLLLHRDPQATGVGAPSLFSVDVVPPFVGQHREVEQQQLSVGFAAGRRHAAAQVEGHGELLAGRAVVGHRVLHPAHPTALGLVSGKQQAGLLAAAPVAVQQLVGGAQVALALFGR